MTMKLPSTCLHYAIDRIAVFSLPKSSHKPLPADFMIELHALIRGCAFMNREGITP